MAETGAIGEGGPAHPDMEEQFNRDGGLEVPGCWTAVIRRRSKPLRPLTSNDLYFSGVNTSHWSLRTIIYMWAFTSRPLHPGLYVLA